MAGNEIAQKVTKLSNTPLKNNSETAESKIKMSEQKYISPVKSQKIDGLWLM